MEETLLSVRGPGKLDLCATVPVETPSFAAVVLTPIRRTYLFLSARVRVPFFSTKEVERPPISSPPVRA